jgi:hypothetical protein
VTDGPINKKCLRGEEELMRNGPTKNEKCVRRKSSGWRMYEQWDKKGARDGREEKHFNIRYR